MISKSNADVGLLFASDVDIGAGGIDRYAEMYEFLTRVHPLASSTHNSSVVDNCDRERGSLSCDRDLTGHVGFRPVNPESRLRLSKVPDELLAES